MTILHCIASSFWGGGEKYVFDLSSRLLDDNHRVIIYSPKCQVIADKFSRFSDNRNFSFVTKKVSFFAQLLQLLQLIRKENVNVVHIHNTRSLFLFALSKVLSKRRIRLVMTIHLVKRAKRNLMRRCETNQVDRLVFVSRLAADTYLSGDDSIDENKVCVVHNSILPSDENADNQMIDGRCACFIGRLHPEKGIEVLLRALAKSKAGLRLRIVGSGTPAYEAFLHQMVADLDLSERVEFAGFASDVAPYMRHCLFAVLPSVRPESFGLTNIEFMRMAKAQIATDNGAQKEYLRDGETAFLVPAGDEAALIEKMNYLFENQTVAVEMGRKAKSFFEKELSYDVFYEKMLNIYEDGTENFRGDSHL